jgi:hypothetical protein
MTNVAAGSYAIFAKTIIDPGVTAEPIVACTLTAGGDVDTAEIAFPNDHMGPVNLQVTHTFPATGSIVLSCHSTWEANARVTKIVALKVDTVTRTAVSG